MKNKEIATPAYGGLAMTVLCPCEGPSPEAISGDMKEITELPCLPKYGGLIMILPLSLGGCLCYMTYIDKKGKGVILLKEVRMATFILMTKLPPEVSKRMRERAEIGREWIKRVKEKCPQVKFIAHYALLGPYDFLDIYEAPNEEIAAKVSMISLSMGALEAQSWTAIPYKRFLELTREI